MFRRNKYTIPNQNENDWKYLIDNLEIITSCICKTVVRFQEKKQGQRTKIITAEDIFDIMMSAKYPYKLLDNMYMPNSPQFTAAYIEIIVLICNGKLKKINPNLEELGIDERIELAKAYCLQSGINEQFLDKLTLPEKDKQKIIHYFKIELNRFILPNSCPNIEYFFQIIKSVDDKNILQKLAYDFIGCYRLFDFDKTSDALAKLFSSNSNNNIEQIQNYIVILFKNMIRILTRKGFINYLKLPDEYYKASDSKGKRKPYVKGDEEIKVTHGGGFFYLLDFFMGYTAGYRLEKYKFNDSGLGIQVSPIPTGRDEYYAKRKSPLSFDHPCILSGTIIQNRLERAPNVYEAGLRAENKIYLMNIKLQNLMSGEIIEAANYDELIKKIALWNESYQKAAENFYHADNKQNESYPLVEITPQQTDKRFYNLLSSVGFAFFSALDKYEGAIYASRPDEIKPNLL